MEQQRVHERSRPVARRGVHHHSGRLVDYEQVRVLVRDRQRDGFGQDRRRHGRRQLEVDRVARDGPPALAGRRGVHEHAALRDELRDARAREVRTAGGEIGVEALFHGRGLDHEASGPGRAIRLPQSAAPPSTGTAPARSRPWSPRCPPR